MDPRNLDDVPDLADVYRFAAFPPHSQAPLEILSASAYQEHMHEGYVPHRNPGTRQYFGVLVNEDTNVVGESSSRQRPRQGERLVNDAASSSSSSMQTNKKQRGRPRLDPQDETPAERRRTQIRLAQRAYRNRKETTISELKGQVSELQGSINQMSRTFSMLHDNLFDSGVLNSLTPDHPIVQQLEQMMDHFAEVSRPLAESDRENQMGSGQIEAGDARFSSRRSRESDESSVEPETWPQTMSEVRNHSTRANRTTDYQPGLVFQPPKRRLVTLAEISEIESQLFGFLDLSRRTAAGVERPLNYSGRYTYSFQETTFAR